MRLDLYLAQIYDFSRQKAKELIESGKVKVCGRVVLRPSFQIQDKKSEIEIDESDIYVSRAALKLKNFLQNNPIEILNKRVLDIGSSTGGFAQILLDYGALEVVCVDVGKEQLHKNLRNNPKVCLFEQTDIRHFDSSPFELITCDISFISLAYILGDIYRLCSHEAVLLFKPQFEVGKNVKRNARGVVQDKQSCLIALESIQRQISALGFKICCTQSSMLTGKNGNEETFIHIAR
ncbi:hypothetical protein CCZ01_02355 [Helicobacter monodelphidis]|uniref:23S rRNA (cytidine-2'-O)-methyltransferase TlyA n=1 Tax=Helicobacter sp. 15-1451 TaxID=2004995 RepID=UPI000DCCD633|nr:TlyA family RNA methyltransferase [Helicobacter sp. 15-1451]RAX58645.1 hypothetical protein CCZ01_02355 [Helicobacter sp. 15-1451]